MRKKFPKKRKAEIEKQEYDKVIVPGAKQSRPDGKMGHLTVSPFVTKSKKDLEESDEGHSTAELRVGPNSRVRQMLKKINRKKRRQHDNLIKKQYREDFT